MDEIHALVATKRGSHLALSLERLEELAKRPLQRIGLSATQRPLEVVSRYLGGGEGVRAWKPRPVSIVDAGGRKKFDIKVEVPVEDMARLGEPIAPLPIGNAKGPRGEDLFVREMGPTTFRAKARPIAGGAEAGVTPLDEIPEGPASIVQRRSIWPSIHPRLLELIRAHRSTILFTNSRRLAERLAAALNELAGEELVQGPPRFDRARAAASDRGRAQVRAAAGDRRHVIPRAGHRHGRRRPGDPDRDPAVRGERDATHRPREPPGGG